MIDLDYFEEDRSDVEEILGVTAGHLSRHAGHRAGLRLVPSLDVATRERVLGLGAEVFGADGAVFDEEALEQVADDPDALFVALDIDHSLEGFCFGYYEEDGARVVDGTDFFLDSAVVSPRWQRHRLGWLAAAATLLVVAELGDVRRVGLAVWGGGDVHGLLSLYHRLGFADATSATSPYPCLSVTLLPERVDGWRGLLGLPPAPRGRERTVHPHSPRPGQPRLDQSRPGQARPRAPRPRLDP